MIVPGSFRLQAQVQPRASTPNALGTFSLFLDGALLNHVFHPSIAYTPPAALHVALFTIAPTNAGGGMEVGNDPNYARQTIVFGNAASGTPPTIANSAAVSWNVATVDWGQITSAGIYDQATAGNFLAYGMLLASDGVTQAAKLVQQGDVFMINAGAMIVGLL